MPVMFSLTWDMACRVTLPADKVSVHPLGGDVDTTCVCIANFQYPAASYRVSIPNSSQRKSDVLGRRSSVLAVKSRSQFTISNGKRLYYDYSREYGLETLREILSRNMVSQNMWQAMVGSSQEALQDIWADVQDVCRDVDDWLDFSRQRRLVITSLQTCSQLSATVAARYFHNSSVNFWWGIESIKLVALHLTFSTLFLL